MAGDKGIRDNFQKMFGPLKPPAEPPPDDAPDEKDEELGTCCAAVPRHKSTMALTVKHPGGSESFQYREIGVRSEYKPTQFVIGFADGHERYRITVTGRNLERIYTLITQARLEWLRADPRGEFADDGKPVITKIEVVPVEEKRK